jgi:iron(III) transport system permease protein
MSRVNGVGRVNQIVLTLGLVAFAGLPLGALLAHALTTPELSWRGTWTSHGAVAALRGTLLTSTGASAVAFAVGFPLALLVGRTDVPGAGWLRAVFTLPSALPPFILGMGWISLANPRAGLLNLVLGPGTLDIYGAVGISFVLGSAAIPLVFLPTLATVERLDASLEEAARLSGATPLRALWAVSVPLGLPAATSGAALAFLFASSAFGVPYLLGVTASPPTPTLATRLYSEVLMGSGGLGRAAVLSVELLGLAGLVLLGSRRLACAGHVALPAGKGGSRRPMPLAWLRWPLALSAWAFAVVLVVLPLGAVALTSLQPVWGQFGAFSVHHWHSVLSSARTLDAAARSIELSLVAAALVTTLGLAVAWTRRSWLETLGAAPYAVPGTVLALALLIAFSRDLRFIAFERVAFVLALGNTATLLLIAWVVKHLAFGVRNAVDGVAQLDPSLAEAARLCGATPRRAFFDATLPQLRAPLAAAFLVTFLTCMTELTVSVLLIPTGRDVLGTLLFDLQSYADPGAAAVIACAFVLLVLGGQALRAVFTRGAR